MFGQSNRKPAGGHNTRQMVARIEMHTYRIVHLALVTKSP